MQLGHVAVCVARVAGLVAVFGCAGLPPLQAQERVRLGIEVLLSDSIHLVRGKRVGLITNHTGVLPDGRSTIDLLHRATGVRLTALFGPEHGIRGVDEAGVKIESNIDSATGVPVYSLYGRDTVPSAEMLRNVDVVLYDIQDVGASVYTYVWTMALSAQAVTKHGKEFIVLDRPNPVRGDRVQGGNALLRPLNGPFPVPLRYGLTPGELLRYLIGAGQINARAKVVPMSGWRRDMWWEGTGLPWRNPSPNIKSVDGALLYTGTVVFEATNLSEGRGTPSPFQLIGASWLHDAGEIARDLNSRGIPGVSFDSTLVTIEEGQKWGGHRIPMIAVAVTDRAAVQPYRVGLAMLRAVYVRHKGEFQWKAGSYVLTTYKAIWDAIELDRVDALIQEWDRESRDFQTRSAPYLIYR